jgi:SAM-dependent methyltransferase
MFKRFATRNLRLERLDTGDYTPEEYVKWQSEMKLINRFLGDTRILKLSLEHELPKREDHVSILDVGAGSGELLKAAKEMMNGKTAFLVGAELNTDAVRSIRDRSFGVHALQCDALRLPFSDGSFDFVVSSLLLHHLDDECARCLIAEMQRVARRGFFIIDLHRHPAAYYLYRLFGSIFLQRFTLEDGSLSILRSFRPHELRRLADQAGVQHPVVKRRAAFRLVLSGSKNGHLK